MAGQALISGQLTGVAGGSIVNIGPFSIVANTANNLQILTITLASGTNTITVPSWAVGVIIVPNVTNAVNYTLKAMSTDTGFPLSLTAPSIISFDATPLASFDLAAASAFSTATEIWFF